MCSADFIRVPCLCPSNVFRAGRKGVLLSARWYSSVPVIGLKFPLERMAAPFLIVELLFPVCSDIRNEMLLTH